MEAGRPAAKERTGGKKDIHAATQTPEGGMTVDGVIVTPEERKGVQEHYEDGASGGHGPLFRPAAAGVKAAAGRRAQADGGREEAIYKEDTGPDL